MSQNYSRRRHARRAAPSRLGFEPLEPRMVLTTFFVDGVGGDGVGGDDSNSGTAINSAFATISRAAAAAQQGDTILIRGGVYRETVDPPRSGTEQAPIRYEAFGGEEVTISGGEVVTGWTLFESRPEGDIFRATVVGDIAGGAGNTVFVDGEYREEATYPNLPSRIDIDSYGEQDTLLTNGTNTAAVGIVASDIAGEFTGAFNPSAVSDNSIVGAQIRYHRNAFVIETGEVTAFDSNSGVISVTESAPGVAQRNFFRYYLFGDFDTIDVPGEWFKDVNDNTLYYQALPGQTASDLNDGTVEVEFKQRAFGFNLRNTQHTEIVGIDFGGVSIDLDAGSSNLLLEGNVFDGYDRGLFGRFFLAGDDHVVRGNTFTRVESNAITVDGNRNQIVNNLFEEVGFDAVGNGSGVTLRSDAADNLIAHNTFRLVGRSSIGSPGRNTEVAFNLFEDTAQLTYDTGGAVYWIGDGGGLRFHHNIVRNVDRGQDNFGVYLDFQGGNAAVYNNIFENINRGAVSIGAPNTSFLVFNNTFFNTGVDNGQAIARSLTNPDGVTAFGSLFLNNLVTDITASADPELQPAGNFEFVPSDFVNPGAGDFRLAAGSGAIDAGVVIPGVTDGFSGAAPDVGAIEFGESVFDVGHDFANPPTVAFDPNPLPQANRVDNALFDIANLSGWQATGPATGVRGNGGNFRFFQGLSWLGFNSAELRPGGAISQTLTGLQPDTVYRLAANARTIGLDIQIEDRDGQSGSFTTSTLRDETGLGSIDNNEWLRFDNIDFGDGEPLFDRIELSYIRNQPEIPFSAEVLLGSPGANPLSGTLQSLGTFEFDAPNDPYFVTGFDLAEEITGTHSVFLRFADEGPQNPIILDRLRLLDTTLAPDEQVTLGARGFGDSESGTEVTTQIGGAYWQQDVQEILFRTGPQSTSAEIFLARNSGRFTSYVDGILVTEATPGQNLALGAPAAQSSTAGSSGASQAVDGSNATVSATENLASSFLQVDLGGSFAPSEIVLRNPVDALPRALGNFRVSVFESDPTLGAVEVWGQDYFPTGGVAPGASFVIAGGTLADDGATELNEAVGRFVRVQLLGVNNELTGSLSLADLQVNFVDSDNLALRATATQSSTNGPATASRAIDGDRNSFSETLNQPGGFLQVDLPLRTGIGEINLHNVTGAPASQLSNFRVSVFDTAPDRGGQELWGRNYFTTAQGGGVDDGGVFRLDGSEIADDGVTRLASVFGRTLRVQLIGNGLNNAGTGVLSLAEVEIFDSQARPSSSNLARSGTADQSSFRTSDGFPQFAIDGNLNPFFERSSVTSTLNEPNSFWQVDLGAAAARLDQLVLINRQEVPERLSDFEVSVWDRDPSAPGAQVLWVRDFFPSGSVGAGDSLVINGNSTSQFGGVRLDQVVGGTFVRVQLNGNNNAGNGILSLTEVQVWGESVNAADIRVDRNLAEYFYDLGTADSDLFVSADPYQRLTDQASGDIFWAGDISSADRGNAAGNDINQDLVLGTTPATLEHAIANGVWRVLVTFGDGAAALDNIGARAEGQAGVSGVNRAAGQFANEIFQTTVLDGSLSLEFFDADAADPRWGVTRVILTRLSDPPPGLAPGAANDTFMVAGNEVLQTQLGVDDLLQNDADPQAGPLTVSTTPVAAPRNGDLVLNADGTFVYTPDASFTGVDAFVYEVADSDGLTDQAIATIFVDAVDPLVSVGDYNGDRVVDVADYTVWRDALGDSMTPFTGADGDGSGVVDNGDYTIWQQNFGLEIPLAPPHAADFSGVQISADSNADRFDSFLIEFQPASGGDAATLFADNFTGYNGLRLDNPNLDGGWDNVSASGAGYSAALGGGGAATGEGVSQNSAAFNTAPLTEEGVITFTLTSRIRGSSQSGVSLIDAGGSPILTFGNPSSADGFDVLGADGQLLLNGNDVTFAVSNAAHSFFDLRLTYDTATRLGTLETGPGSSTGATPNGPFELVGAFDNSENAAAIAFVAASLSAPEPAIAEPPDGEPRAIEAAFATPLDAFALILVQEQDHAPVTLPARGNADTAPLPRDDLYDLAFEGLGLSESADADDPRGAEFLAPDEPHEASLHASADDLTQLSSGRLGKSLR